LSMTGWEDLNTEELLAKAERLYETADPAHDFSHITRVLKNAEKIGRPEGADMRVLMLSALLHDAGSLSKGKSQPSDSKSPRLAEHFLDNLGLDEDVKAQVLYAIEVHRYSKGILPATLEARILQDADRLDAMGAIGIARAFMTGGSLGRKLYHPQDPFCKSREPDDREWNVDHFYRKLLRLESGMHTKTAKRMARERAVVLKRYLEDLEREIQD